MTPAQIALAILSENPHAVAVHLDDPRRPKLIIVHIHDEARQPLPGTYATHPARGLSLPPGLPRLPIQIRRSEPVTDLRTRHYGPHAANQNQQCQNEPIKLGCQIQPAGANWVGTAGAPVKWRDQQQRLHWGILSNRHVLVPDSLRLGHAEHQPTSSSPACAFLAAFTPIRAIGTNYVDAAVADATVDGKHTISTDILDVGPLACTPVNAWAGLPVAKSGRTTGLTKATCTAVGAAVRVSYGSFTALFADQDMFEAASGVFSAPGDSGSMIFANPSLCPVSLLFAGGGSLTIGNPIRYVIKALDLVFPFP